MIQFAGLFIVPSSNIDVNSVAYSDCNLAISIPQDNCTAGLDFPIPINNIDGTSLGDDVELTEARIIISHSWELDLRISLRSPSGVVVPLSFENGTSDSNTNYGDISVPDCKAFTAFTMDDCLADLRIDSPSIEKDFIGLFLPEGDFADFDSEDPNGIWYLEVCDKDGEANTGRLEFVELVFTPLYCDAPQNVRIDAVENNKLTVSWDPIPNTQLTLMEVVPHGDSPSHGSSSLTGYIFQTGSNSTTTALELSEATDYDIYVRTTCSNGQFSKNSCPIFVQTNCTTQAVTLAEDFDSATDCINACGVSCNLNGVWNNVSYDNFDWTVNSGETPNLYTGPSSDVSSNGKYLYIESNSTNCQNNNNAILESNCLQISSANNNCHFSFYFHMFGNGVGDLSFEVLPQGAANWQTLWSQFGQIENEWLRQYIDLGDYHGQNVKVRFVSKNAKSGTGDMAIDELTFYGAQDNGTPSFVHYKDADNDGFGNPNLSIALCSSSPPTGYVSNGQDCDDNNPNIKPGAFEIGCNGIDENCNGSTDDNTVSSPISFFQNVCSGEEVSIEVFGTLGYQTNWYSDASRSSLLGTGNPILLDLESGAETIYAQNLVQSGPGLRLTEISLNVPFSLEVQSIGVAKDYTGWKIYANSVTSGENINNYIPEPWELSDFVQNEIKVRVRTDWSIPVIWTNNKPGWVMLIDNQGQVRDAIFWNWSDTEMSSLNIGIDGSNYNINNIPWSGSAISLNTCSNSVSLFGDEELNTKADYDCAIGNIGSQNIDLNYIVECASPLVAVDIFASQAPNIDYLLDNDPCDNGSISSGIELLVNDGIGPFSYSWSNGSNQQNQSNLLPGTYNVTVTGGNGCQSILSDILIGSNSSSLGVVTREINDVSCFGAADGMVIVEVNGGASPFQFNWVVGVAREDVEENIDTLTNLPSGYYAVTVTDNNGCVNSVDFEIGEPDEVTIEVSTSAPLCQNSFDGFINLSTTGGNSPYSYDWSNGRTSSDNINLSFGSYQVTIQDDNGCFLVSDPIIFEPINDTIVFEEIIKKDILCKNSDFGSIEVDFSGGVGELSYFWDNGQSGSFIQELESGFYNLTVSDEQDCQYYLSNIEILEASSELNISYNFVNASCSGLCDGVASVNATGGLPPYTYNWSTGEETSLVSNLCEGIVGLTVTDAFGCQKIFNDEINVLANQSTLEAIVQVDSISCFEEQDGSILVNMQGGIPPYSFNWDIPSNIPNPQSLNEGTYNCTVTDNEGCEFYIEDVEIAAPSRISLDDLVVVRASSGQQDGSISIQLKGGNGNFEVKWYDQANEFLGTGLTLENISVGNYAFIATDSRGCEFSRSNIVVELSTSLEESHIIEHFEIYPNPTKDYIIYDIILVEQLDLELKVFSLVGEQLFTKYIHDSSLLKNRISFGDYPPGLYFITLWDSDQLISRQSFVLE